MFDNRFDVESILGFVGMINGFEQLMKVIIGRQPEIAVIIRPGMGMIPPVLTVIPVTEHDVKS